MLPDRQMIYSSHLDPDLWLRHFYIQEAQLPLGPRKKLLKYLETRRNAQKGSFKVNQNIKHFKLPDGNLLEIHAKFRIHLRFFLFICVVRDCFVICLFLKVHKHEIILNFFLPNSKSYMPLVKFRQKFRFFSFDFRQNFEVRTFSRWLSIRGIKLFWRDISKKFFFKKFTWVLLDGFLNGFSKFWFLIVEICILIWDFWVIFENYSMRILSIRGNEFHRTLSIRGKNFIAGWAYAEWITSLAEHMRKCLKVEYLGRIEYDFQKSRVIGPWEHKISVSAKKFKQKNFMLVLKYTGYWFFCISGVPGECCHKSGRVHYWTCRQASTRSHHCLESALADPNP